jgi:anti-anti-sigma factor
MAPFEPGPQMRLLVGEPAQGRVRVTVSGSLDLAIAGELGERLRAAVARGPRMLVLDLAAVDFCDCAALGVLIGVRDEGQRTGCAVVISAASPAVALLLGLLGLDGLLGYPPPGPGRGEFRG